MKRRKQGHPVDGWPGVKSSDIIGRVYTIHPNNKECFFLRLLLHKIPGPTSFDYLKNYEGQKCQTFMESCQCRGLLHDDTHWHDTMTEAVTLFTAYQMRNLFAIMLQFCDLANPLELWEKHKLGLSEDLIHRAKSHNASAGTNVPMLEDRVYNECLVFIEDHLLQLGGQRLSYYGLPEAHREVCNLDEEVSRELSYHVDTQDVLEQEHKLLAEQKHAFDIIYNAIEGSKGGLYFIDAPGGTGKTFLLNLLLSKVRLNLGIALATASSGIASTLLIGGRTAHSTFKLPFDIMQNDAPLCNITKQSSRGKLLQQARLIVWDECTMSNRKHVEALDRSLQDLKSNSMLMGGTTLVLAGDFRQTLPVIPRGTKADELKACLKSSYLWAHVNKLGLTTNMRAKIFGDESASEFSKKLLLIGDGKLDRDGVDGLDELPCGEMVSETDELLEYVFTNLGNEYKSHNWLCERAILAPRNDTVDGVNRLLLDKVPGEKYIFYSNDSVHDVDEAVHFPTEFLNSLQPTGIPPHKLILKIGAPVMLLRNLDPPRLCNGTRLAIQNLKNHIVEATIISGAFKGTVVAIPRIPMIPADMPFSFRRVQFPLRLSFAMSINKSQGQSLKVVGLNLEKPCFTHGQLYVGCSRVGSAKNLFVHTPVPGFTENIVYAEALEQTAESNHQITPIMNQISNPNSNRSRLNSDSINAHLSHVSKSETNVEINRRIQDPSENVDPDTTESQNINIESAVSDYCRKHDLRESQSNENKRTTVPTHMSFVFDYCPVGLECQFNLCEAFSWPFSELSTTHLARDERDVRRNRCPRHQSKIVSDGNCWYRTISFLATGNENNYQLIKASILDYMSNNVHVIQKLYDDYEEQNIPCIPPESGVTYSDHAAQDHLDVLSRPNEWADEIVLDMTSCMLKTPVCFYEQAQKVWLGVTVANSYPMPLWEKRDTMRDTNERAASLTELEYKAMYIIHLGQNHFEPAHCGLLPQ